MKEPITGWGRPLRYVGEPYHGVIAIDPHASVQTACRGRWPSSEPGHYLTGRDRTTNEEGRPFKRCGACEDVAGEQRLKEGLREFAAAEVLEVRGLGHGVTELEFDVSDLGDVS